MGGFAPGLPLDSWPGTCARIASQVAPNMMFSAHYTRLARKCGPALGLFVAVLSTFAAMGSAGEAHAGSLELRPIDRAAVRVFGVRGVSGRWLRSPAESARRRFVAAADVSHGTGVVVSTDGLVLTAKSVVARAALVGVMLPGSKTAMRAHVLYRDPKSDVAVLKLDLEGVDFVALPAVAPALKTMQRVSTSGYPYRPATKTPRRELELMPAATSGELSRPTNDGRVHVGIQLARGHVGAAVISAAGEIIGIVSKATDQGSPGMAVMEPLTALSAALAKATAGAAMEPYPVEWDAQVTDIATWLLQGPLALPLRSADAANLRMLAGESGPELQTILAARMWNSVQAEMDRQRAGAISELSQETRARATSQSEAVVEVCRGVRTKVAPAWRFAQQVSDGSVTPSGRGAASALGGPSQSRQGILPVDGAVTIHILTVFSPLFGLGVGVGGHAGVFRYGEEGGAQFVVSTGATATISTTLSDFGDVTMTGSLDIGLIGRFGAFQLAAYYAPGFNLVFNESAWSWEGFRVEFGSTISQTVSYGTSYSQSTTNRFGVIRQLSGYVQIGF